MSTILQAVGNRSQGWSKKEVKRLEVVLEKNVKCCTVNKEMHQNIAQEKSLALETHLDNKKDIYYY